jgi:hypothetical protein
MTYAELRRQLLNLGFETADTYEEEPTIMLDAINRAMREITNLFPLIGSYKIAQHPLPNLLPDAISAMDSRHYDGKMPLQYTAADAKSLYFECSGTGALTILDGDGERTIPLDSKKAFRAYRAFLRGDVTLTFSGPHAYDIKNIAVYGETFSDALADIPAYRKHVRYDVKALTAVNEVPVFIGFLDKVQEGDYSDGKSYLDIKDFRIEQKHILVLDGMEQAEYTIFYKKNFIPFTAATPDSFPIELDYDKEHLLPLLAAWYVWEDDEPTKAAKWRNDYEDYVARLLNEAKPQSAQEAFHNDLGW